MDNNKYSGTIPAFLLGILAGIIIIIIKRSGG